MLKEGSQEMDSHLPTMRRTRTNETEDGRKRRRVSEKKIESKGAIEEKELNTQLRKQTKKVAEEKEKEAK